MREKKQWLIVTFYTTSAAMAAEKACGQAGLPGRIIPVPRGCGVATLSISYYDLGVTTGKMAAKILKGEANISEMPVEYTDATPKYNASICDQLGITPLDGYEAIDG